MNKNQQVELTALDAYYKERNLTASRDKKLDERLEDKKWNKFYKRRKKLFSDYDQVLKKLSDERVKEIDSIIKKFDKLASSGLSDSSKAFKKIAAKSITYDDSIKKLTINLADSEQQEKNAKNRIKSMDKLSRSLTSKLSQENTSNNKYSKVSLKIQPLKGKADTSLKIIQDNFSTSKINQKKLDNSHKEIVTGSPLINERLDQLKLSAEELKTYKSALFSLKNEDPALILNSDLSARINASTKLKALKNLSEGVKKSLENIGKIDTSYTSKNIIRQNKTELNKIAKYISRANSLWIAISTTEELDFYDTQPFYAYYEGVRIHPTATTTIMGVARNPFLKNDLNTAYTFKKKKGDLVKIENIGWCKYDAFYTQQEKERREYLDRYTAWLNSQYHEMKSLKGEKKLDRIKGILSQAQIVIERYESSSPLTIDTLDKAPAFRSDQNQTTCPHELIKPLRSWVELTEKKIRTVREETNSNENAGSLYSDIDWNSYLKIPQYRTQSDNLISPESTCAPTTFTMMAERAGWSRSDIITAIEKLFHDGGSTNIADTWKTMGVKFLKWINKHGTKNYQRVRGGKIRAARFDELAKDFKHFGQYEDLTIFYHYLINSASKTSINSDISHNDKLRQGLENDGNFKKMGTYKYVKRSRFKSDIATRKLVKEHLDLGNVVMFSIYHKGAGSGGTHNYFVQSINHKGFIIDDPFGMGNEEYRRKTNITSDLYKDKGGNKHRDKYDFKNRPDFNPLKKDFTTQAGQDLSKDESRGDSSLLSWEALERSDERIINYVVAWVKKVR